MKYGMCKLLAASSCFFIGSAIAEASDSLSGLEGYTIVLSSTVSGYKDANGKREDSFNGCEFDRIIIFDNRKILTCATYSYTYSYRPTAIVFSNGSSFKMLVGNTLYDMRQ